MRITFKPSLMKVRRSKVRWIIIHHTSEMYENPESKIDNSKFQIPGLAKGVLEKKHADINYHYVVDKIKDDYMAIACRPFIYLCDWPDIHPDINNNAVHVALLGNYDFKVVEKRCYEVLAYRLLNPFMKMFLLSPSRIKLHRNVSSIEDLTCPGDFVNEDVIETMVRKFVIK